MLFVVVFIAFAFVSGAQSQDRQLWNEINVVKEEAEDIEKISYDMVKRLGLLSQYSEEYTPPREDPTPRPPSGYPRSCLEYFQRGDTRSGLKTIDPFANNDYIVVKCEYDGRNVITEIGLDGMSSEDYSGPLSCYDSPELRVPGYVDLCAGARTNVPYRLSYSQMSAAIAVSGRCSQRVAWDCLSNSILYLHEYTGNVTLYGRSMDWQSASLRQGVCRCGMERRCHLCNCGKDRPNAWSSDDIVVEDNSRLPVSAVALGDLVTKHEQARVSVYPIRCSAPYY